MIVNRERERITLKVDGRKVWSCIRLRTTDDAWLAHHTTIGDPLLVR